MPAPGSRRRRSPCGRYAKDTGGLLISLDVCDPAAQFPFVDTDWRANPGASRYTGYTGLHLESPSPNQMATRWSRLLGQPAEGGRIQLPSSALTVGATSDDTRIAVLELGSRTA